MASLNNAICKNIVDNILPTFGTPKTVPSLPIWDDSQKMFLCDQYQSASGNFYYRGIRFCNRIAIIEKVGLYHSCTYIDSIEIYAFNGEKPELIQKRDYEKVFRNESFIRKESQAMVRDFITSIFKSQNVTASTSEIEKQAEELVSSCYKSFLDRDYNAKLTQILPAIEQK